MRSIAVTALVLSSCTSPSPSDPVSADAATGADARVTIDAAPAPDAPLPIDAPSARDVRCGDPTPVGATVPPPPPTYSGGACPALVPGRNVLRSGGVDRAFELVVPTADDGAAHPLFYFWHALGADADSMVDGGQIQDAADRLGIIGVVPEAKGDLTIALPFLDPIDMAWPYLTTASDARVAEELRFFDDLYACVSAQFAVDAACVSSAGVSAGGLWTAQLMAARSERLASALIISGGVGPATGVPGFEIRPWRGATRKVPALIGWGGTVDQCGANFDTASRNLEAGLAAGGHFVMECVHNCGHGVPPVDHATGLSALYQFALDHPYWLRPGESPYQVRGMAPGTPPWCGLGVGAATPRTGACDAPVCPIPAL